MNKNHWLLSITISIAALTGCANLAGPDDHGRICEPGVMLVDTFGCLTGCDLDASAYFCTADGRGQECRIVTGRVCRTDPGCPGGGADCERGTGACERHGTTSCPAGSSVASVCSAVSGSPVAEVCGDALDNDCNGAVDNGCSTCVSTEIPAERTCDNLDNDCDTRIDEGCDDDNDDHCDGTMNMGPSGSIHCPRTPPGRTVGDDCDDTNPGRCPSAVEICGNGIDEDCNGSDLACSPTCTPTGPEICGNGIDEDCIGGDRVCEVCTENLGGTLRIRPTPALLATCSRGLVTVAWGPGGTELRSVAGATSYSIVMNASWRGWVRLQAFCPDNPSRGSEIGYWAGTVTDWNPRIGNTLRSAGFVVDIDGIDLSDEGYVCRESFTTGLSKPHVPLDNCSRFMCAAPTS